MGGRHIRRAKSVSLVNIKVVCSKCGGATAALPIFQGVESSRGSLNKCFAGSAGELTEEKVLAVALILLKCCQGEFACKYRMRCDSAEHWAVFMLSQSGRLSDMAPGSVV